MNPIIYPKELRGRWYLSVEKYGKSVKETCSLFGISRQTYYKWYALDHGRGPSNYQPEKQQPNTKLTSGVKQLIEQEKLKFNYGPLKMKHLLKRRLDLEVSTTIIYRFYQKKHLIRRPQKKLAWYEPMKERVIPHQAGEVVQIDTKYVWEDGQRKYQRTFIDIFTGFQHAVVVDSLEAEATIYAFKETELVFPFKILGVQTDNGSENRGVFHQYLVQQGIAHYFIPKSSPSWNGAVERAHGVIDQEYYLNPNRPWKTLGEYLYWYNHERVHLGKYLNGLTPQEKFQQNCCHQFQPVPVLKVSVLTVN